MITDLDAACAQMKRERLIAKGKILDEYKLFYYRKKLFRLLLAPWWPDYLKTRTRPMKRASLLRSLWITACRKITLDMSVEDAMTAIDVQKFELSAEDRTRPVKSVRPPSMVAGVPEKKPARPTTQAARRLGSRLDRENLNGLRVRLYRMTVSMHWGSYRRAAEPWSVLDKAWCQAQRMIPEDLPIQEAREVVENTWAGMSERERRRNLHHLAIPGPPPEPPDPESQVRHTMSAYLDRFCEKSEDANIELDLLRRRYNAETDGRVTATGIRRMLVSAAGKAAVDPGHLLGYSWRSTRSSPAVAEPHTVPCA